MELAARIVQQHFQVQAGELVIGGIPISRIAQDYPTPFFIYDRGILSKKLELLRRALPDGFDVYYSIKANPNPSVARFFVSQGCGLEIASDGEFYRALGAGCPPGRTVFAGPGKTEPELDFTLRQGIGEIHVESLIEIERISGICRRRGLRASVAVRVNPGEEAQGGAMRMGGKPSPFGIDEESLEEAVERIRGEERLDFTGVHLFTGTQILDHNVLFEQYQKALAIAARASRKAGLPIRTVDFGGGLGIPYFPNDRELDLESFGGALAPAILAARKQPELAQARFVVEPGRFLAGEAGVYVARVNTIKTSRGKKFLVADGGMNHHLAASGNLGQVIKRNFPVAILNRLDSPPSEVVDVVGPLCTPLDVLARDVALPPARVGDLVFQSGAYARTASPLGFLSKLHPAEIFVEDGACRLSRPPGGYQDLD